MERLYTRCARFSLKSHHAAAVTPLRNNARRFSGSRILRDEDDQSPSDRSARTSSTGAAARPRTSRSNLLIQKTPNRPAPIGARPPPGTVLRRSEAPRKVAAGGRASPGTVLRRTRPSSSARAPGESGTGTGRGRGPQPTRAAGVGTDGKSAPAKPQNRVDRRLRQARARQEIAAAQEEQEENMDEEVQIENYIKEVIDRPENPTEELPHVPGQDMSLEALRADWPNTPLSGTGLTESVQQRIEWLAQRIPHGYQTPAQLAERYYKGYFTRFESEAEKQEVLKLATEMARKKADEATEHKYTEVTPRDMSFEDVVSRSAERQRLADTFVRGKYPEVQKQKMPFLDQIVRNLNNNDTYNGRQTEKFMEMVQKVMAGQPGDLPRMGKT
ncbi:uncharacterized protein Z518_09188 [Rhinocladiella mackenziei CBS 650.93]|uniref:Uncharacterized protein n=1 Tax=Rhinocladiella mackenziei CBS 650.93 TaxID=1442369 RepID=A0A0D2FHK4_9EURO|nr:uncharacterized protein Z518_09188 [Rhinocladiella mackenziei CBS 650.93]KIX01462.1 hypothetical protein Z518_09188 [Rhinocladiella mackenziei CBS 650.93]